MYEFYHLDAEVDVPWIGQNITPTAGVVLFNYAFSVTVPAWLIEKKPGVSVNRTIWTATTFSSIVYILFGWIGATAFQSVSTNIFVLLASSKVYNKSHFPPFSLLHRLFYRFI